MEIRQFRVVIRTKNFERALKFYGEALALPQVQSWDREDGRGVAFQAGSAIVEVLGRPSSEDPRLNNERYDPEGPLTKTVLTFDVASAQKAYDEILDRKSVV